MIGVGGEHLADEVFRKGREGHAEGVAVVVEERAGVLCLCGVGWMGG